MTRGIDGEGERGGKRESKKSMLSAQLDEDDVKAKIDISQQNNLCRLRGDKDETVDYIRKVFYWELCKKLKFDHTTKWYMHKLVSVPEMET